MATATWYIRNTAPLPATKPSGFLGAWTFKDTGEAGSSANALEDAGGSSTETYTKANALNGSGATDSCGAAQFLSPPLAPQSISAGNWTVAFSVSQAATAAFCTWQGAAALYLVNGSTGAIRTTIFTITGIGSSGRACGTTYKTSYSTAISGAAFSPQDGDYLALEVGAYYTQMLGGITVTNRVRGGNTTAISSDNATNATPNSLTTSPTALERQAYTLSGTKTLPTMTGSGTGLTFTGGAGTYTLSGSATLPVMSGSGAGLVVTNPTYTLSGSAALAMPAGSGAGLVVTPPTYSLSGTGTLPALSGGGAGLTFSPPVYTLSGTAALPAMTGGGSGLTFTAPVYTLSGTATIPDMTGGGTGLTYTSASVLSGSAALPSLTGTGSGLTFTAPVFTLSGTAALPTVTTGGAGLVVTPPYFTLSGAATLSSPTGSGAGLTVTAPTYTLSGTAAVPAMTGSGYGLLTPDRGSYIVRTATLSGVGASVLQDAGSATLATAGTTTMQTDGTATLTGGQKASIA